MQHRESLRSHYFWVRYCIYTSIEYVYTSVTITKIRYITVDARLYTHKVKTKTQKAVQSSLRAKIHTIVKKKVNDKKEEEVVTP